MLASMNYELVFNSRSCKSYFGFCSHDLCSRSVLYLTRDWLDQGGSEIKSDSLAFEREFYQSVYTRVLEQHWRYVQTGGRGTSGQETPFKRALWRGNYLRDLVSAKLSRELEFSRMVYMCNRCELQWEVWDRLTLLLSLESASHSAHAGFNRSTMFGILRWSVKCFVKLPSWFHSESCKLGGPT